MKVQLLLLPESSGRFQEHLKDVGKSLKEELKKSYAVRLGDWNPSQQDGDTAVLILFQSQGRPGDEFPHVFPEELKKGRQRVVVAVVQDDEWTSCSKDIVPGDVSVVSVVSLHVVPGQHQLHAPASSLCPRNTETVKQIARDLRLPSKEDGPMYLYWHDVDSLSQNDQEAVIAKLEGSNIEFLPNRTEAEPVLFCLRDDDEDFDKKKNEADKKYSKGTKLILATVHKPNMKRHETVDKYRGWNTDRLRVCLCVDEKGQVRGAETAVKEIGDFLGLTGLKSIKKHIFKKR